MFIGRKTWPPRGRAVLPYMALVHILVVKKPITGAIGLRMRRVNRLDRACAVFYRQLSDNSVAVRH